MAHYSDEKWPYVSIEQRSPSGENVLGEIFFLCCPTCGAMISSGGDEEPTRFRDLHVDWHESTGIMEQ